MFLNNHISTDRSYILHISRETFSCGGNGTLHFPQEVLFCLWTANILFDHKVSKTPAQCKDTMQYSQHLQIS